MPSTSVSIRPPRPPSTSVIRAAAPMSTYNPPGAPPVAPRPMPTSVPVVRPPGYFQNPHRSQIDTIQSQLSALRRPVTSAGRFNPEYAGVHRNLDQQQVNAQTQAQQSRNFLNEDLSRNQTEAGRLRTEALQELEARMADSGILRSGINLDAQGDTNNAYARSLNDLLSQYTRSSTGVESDLVNMMTGIGGERERALFSQRRDESQSALQDQQRRAQAIGELEYAQRGLGDSWQRNVDNQNSIGQAITQLFNRNQVNLGYGVTEDPNARLNRMIDEVTQGTRTLSDVERSVRNLALQQRGQGFQSTAFDPNRITY